MSVYFSSRFFFYVYSFKHSLYLYSIRFLLSHIIYNMLLFNMIFFLFLVFNVVLCLFSYYDGISVLQIFSSVHTMNTLIYSVIFFSFFFPIIYIMGFYSFKYFFFLLYFYSFFFLFLILIFQFI